MKKLNWIEITSLYIGVIMGAGFASGRECWQFFGVFGKNGYYGAIASTICFVLLACMLTYIARSKNTADLGRLISPFDNRYIDDIIEPDATRKRLIAAFDMLATKSEDRPYKKHLAF